ncbi:MAG: G8 domain-containing protein [Pseudomonadota bacterium]
MFRAFVFSVIFLAAACGGGGSSSDGESPTPPSGGSGNDQPGVGQTGGGAPPTASTNHCGMIPSLVDLSLVTATAIQNGSWTNPDTWGGAIPVDGDRVQIPEGTEVTIAGMLSARLKTLRIDGTLSFSPGNDTLLQVDTLVSTCTGALQIGTEATPIQSDVGATIVFVDDGPVGDPNLVGRGALLMGQTVIHGAPKTHRAIIAPHARQGDSVLRLTTTPSGWREGDQLIITGTVPNNPTSDEIRTVSSINGSEITLNAALNLDHSAPRADLNVYVANATRNVEFVSENTATQNRGHIMLMSANANIQNARFTELGRTDKTTELDDFEFLFPDDGAGDDAPATASVTALGGRNVRGRYAIHFHQIGTDPGEAPALVQGSVVFNGPGWGFVNHSSHVNFVDNVSYGLQGAGFYTEAGDEIGTMQGNIAIRTVNSAFTTDDGGAIDPDLRAERMDYGNDGDGFWLTGNRVSLINNVSAGASAHGIIYWADGIMEVTSSNAAERVTVLVSSLPNGDLIPDRQSVPVWWAPLAVSRGNETYGSTIGFRARYIHADNYLGREGASDFHRSPPQSYIDTLSPSFNDLTVWGSRDGVLLNYNERVSLVGARVVGFGTDQSTFQENGGTANTGVGLDIGTDATHGPGTIENTTINGFGAGFVTPVNGRWDVRDVDIADNGLDLFVPIPESNDTQVRLENVSYTTFQVQDDEDASQLPAHISTSP